MMRYAEAECATCAVIRPKNEMREVKIRRTVGKSYGSSGSLSSGNGNWSSLSSKGTYRSGNRNSSRTSSRSSSKTYQRIDRVWVCADCKPPRSDSAPGTWPIIAVGLVAGLFSLGQCGRVDSRQNEALNVTASVPQKADEPSSDQIQPMGYAKAERHNAELDVPVEISPPGDEQRFVSDPVIQDIPDPKSDDYPPCSDKITDHCIG